MSAEVVVNGRFLYREITGVERYAREVTQRLGDKIKFVRPSRDLQGLAGHLWEQIGLPIRLNKRDVLWSPANTGPLSISNQIVTIHDCSPIDHPEWFRKSFAVWYRDLTLRLVSKVALVITHSAFSRERILALGEVAEEKVTTIPCGVDCEYFYPQTTNVIKRVLEKYSIAENYFFTVGTIEPRKNLPTLFKAWEIFHQDYDTFQLVIAGGRGRAFRDVRLNSPPQGVRLLGFVEEHDLPPLYSGAVACINPSVYEGFGLPVLEAMASGTPVIASNLTALPEVVGDAGMLVDPFDVDEMASALGRLVLDLKTRDALIEKGLVRAKGYSWEKTANQVWEAIQGVRDRI